MVYSISWAMALHPGRGYFQSYAFKGYPVVLLCWQLLDCALYDRTSRCLCYEPTATSPLVEMAPCSEILQ